MLWIFFPPCILKTRYTHVFLMLVSPCITSASAHFLPLLSLYLHTNTPTNVWMDPFLFVLYMYIFRSNQMKMYLLFILLVLCYIRMEWETYGNLLMIVFYLLIVCVIVWLYEWSLRWLPLRKYFWKIFPLYNEII